MVGLDDPRRSDDPGPVVGDQARLRHLVGHEHLDHHAVGHPVLDHRRQVHRRRRAVGPIVGVRPDGFGAGEPPDSVGLVHPPIEELRTLGGIEGPRLPGDDDSPGRLVHDVLEQERGPRPTHLDHPDLADRPVVHEPFHRQRSVPKAGHEVDRQLDTRRRAGRDDRVAIGDRGGHRLLDIDVLARGRRGQRLGQVRPVRRSDHDRLDLGPPQERRERHVGRDAELLGQSRCAHAAPDRDELGIRHVPGQAGRIRAAHVPRADEAEPDALTHDVAPPAPPSADRSIPRTRASTLPPDRAGSPGRSAAGGRRRNGTAKTASNASAWRDGQPMSRA